MQDHVRCYQNRVAVLHHYSLFKGHQKKVAPSHKVDNTNFLMMNSKALSACIPLHSALPLLSKLILMSHLGAARTDRLHTQTREPPSRHLLTDQLGARWFSCFVWAASRWEAHGSPESSACCLSASAGLKSFLLSHPGPICTLSFYIYSLQGIPLVLPVCAFFPLSPLLQLLLYKNLVFFPMSKAVWDDFFNSSQVSIPLENS